MCRVVIMGPPGAGKGTQGGRLARQFDVAHIASGDLLRKAITTQAQSDLGRAAQVIVNGHMVSDEVASSIIFRALEGQESTRGFVLDGYPRNVRQATKLVDFLEAHRLSLNAVFALHVSEEVLHLRLSGRLTCGRCGRVFHRVSAPPRVENVCDWCDMPLITREDDDAAGIATRLALYRERTKPVLEFYSQRGLLRTVEANAPMDEVYTRLANHREVWYT